MISFFCSKAWFFCSTTALLDSKKISVRDTDKEACTAVQSHKRPVVHCQTNGQKETSYHLVREELCLSEPCSLISYKHSPIHVDKTMNSPLFGPFIPTSFLPRLHLDLEIIYSGLTGRDVRIAQ